MNTYQSMVFNLAKELQWFLSMARQLSQGGVASLNAVKAKYFKIKNLNLLISKSVQLNQSKIRVSN